MDQGEVQWSGWRVKNQAHRLTCMSAPSRPVTAPASSLLLTNCGTPLGPSNLLLLVERTLRRNEKYHWCGTEHNFYQNHWHPLSALQLSRTVWIESILSKRKNWWHLALGIHSAVNTKYSVESSDLLYYWAAFYTSVDGIAYCTIKINSSVTRHAGAWCDEFCNLVTRHRGSWRIYFRHGRFKISVQRCLEKFYSTVGTSHSIYCEFLRFLPSISQMLWFRLGSEQAQQQKLHFSASLKVMLK
jgi:hypothetical protein